MRNIKLGRIAGAAVTASLATGVLAGTPGASASASTPATVAKPATTAAFVPFSAFIRATAGAQYQPHSAAAVPNAAAFDQMRSYILATYRGVKVAHSYVFGGSYFDCVTILSQPTVRDLGVRKVAAPPAAAPAMGRQTGRALASPLTLGLSDSYGNAVSCPTGTIPMRRISLGQMTAFPTLAAYLAKSPAGRRSGAQIPPAGRRSGAQIPPAGPRPGAQIQPGGPHRYGVGYQYVANYGGNSWLNLWNPSGDFTLSQQWYSNGSGSGTQTVEGGWIHYPAKFGNSAVLFIFSTPDDYTSGCYDLECSGFVQTNSSVALGGAFTNYSTPGGTQWGFSLQWKYYNGNWWMYYQGSAVGYYPGSVFGGGPMATSSSLIEYGGETYTDGTIWPQMGSGAFADAGWAIAAFQKTIFYISQNAPGGTGAWAILAPVVTNPDCYTINVVNWPNDSGWGTYFYFGGPGSILGGIC